MTARESFEHIWQLRHSTMTWALLKDPTGEYIYLHAQLAWEFWQAALEIKSQSREKAARRIADFVGRFASYDAGEILQILQEEIDRV